MGDICRSAKRPGKYPPLFTDTGTAVNSCFSIHHARKLKKIAPKTTLSVTINWKMIDFYTFPRRSMLGVEYTWRITSKLSNQRPPKALFTCVVCLARPFFDCAGAQIFFVFSIFDDQAVLCAVKSDKRKFKDKPFINRLSAIQIKHITAKSNSKLRQKILFDIDYQSFAVVASLFVSKCLRSRWRFFCNEYLASTLSSHF